MAVTYTFPTNVELDIMTQEYVIEREKFIGDKILPFAEYGSQRVRWDEKDSERGMTAPHNMKSDPTIDDRPGSVTREYEPIPFKESDVIKEDELLRARELGTLGGGINLDRTVAQTVRSREDKTFIRAEWLRWKTLTGGFTISENGVFVSETFPVQHYYSVVGWNHPLTAIPLRDGNATKLMFRGTGASAKGAVEYMNQTTLNALLENGNQNDIAGFRSQNFTNVNFSLTQINTILTDRGLPTIEVYDEGWNNEDGDFETFIPDGISITIGKRPMGQVVGQFAQTPSFHRIKAGLPAPGIFTILEVNGQGNRGSLTVDGELLGSVANPNIKITGGVYGGTFLWFPRSVIVKHVFTP